MHIYMYVFSGLCIISTDDGIHIDGLVQDCSISSALAMEILQFGT